MTTCRRFVDAGELAERSLRERANDDGVDPALEVARHVGDGLAPAERDVRLQRDHLPAEFPHGDLERRPRPKRGLLEQHRHIAAVSTSAVGACGPSGRSAFIRMARSMQRSSSAGIEVEDREEILPPCVSVACVISSDTPR